MDDFDPDLHVDLHEVETDNELDVDATKPSQDVAYQFPKTSYLRFSYELLQEHRKRELRSEILTK